MPHQRGEGWACGFWRVSLRLDRGRLNSGHVRLGWLRGLGATALETRPSRGRVVLRALPHPQNSRCEQQGLKLSPLFIHICSTKQLRTHTHAAGEGAGSRSLGNWAGPQTLRHWRGTPAGPPTQPPPRVCGWRKGLMSVSGPRGNVTGEAPWPGPQPPEPRARRGSWSSRPGKVQAWRGAGRRHGPTWAPQVDLS